MEETKTTSITKAEDSRGIGVVVGNQGHLRLLKNLKGEGTLASVEVDAETALMICGGNGDFGCIFKGQCGFCNGEIVGSGPPENTPCPYEVLMMNEKFNAYCDLIVPERENIGLMGMIKEICVLEILITRTQRQMAKTGSVIDNTLHYIDEHGVAHTNTDVSSALKAYLMVFKEKMRALDSMGLTPKARAQIGATIAKDPSTFAAELVTAYLDIERKVKEAANATGTNGPGLPPADNGSADARHGGSERSERDGSGGDIVDAEYEDIDADAGGVRRPDAPESTPEQAAETADEDGPDDEQKHFFLPTPG